MARTAEDMTAAQLTTAAFLTGTASVDVPDSGSYHRDYHPAEVRALSATGRANTAGTVAAHERASAEHQSAGMAADGVGLVRALELHRTAEAHHLAVARGLRLRTDLAA